MILRLGLDSHLVVELRMMMIRKGYAVNPELHLFDAKLDRCVRAYQEDMGLAVDGAVVRNGGTTWPSLNSWPPVVATSDNSPRAARLSKGLATLYDSRELRMEPEYLKSRLDAWERMEAGDERAYVVPLASAAPGHHGATCGHAAWILTSWWMRAMYPDKGIFPTWRTGRGPTSSMPKRFLPLAPVAGIEYGGKLHRGLAEYCPAGGLKRKELADIRGPGNACHWYICQKRSGHVIVVIRIDEHFGCTDPRTGLPAVPGLYRLAADGSKKTIGKPWTWRRVRPGEVGPWSCWGFADLPESGEITWGPLSGAPDLPLVLE